MMKNTVKSPWVNIQTKEKVDGATFGEADINGSLYLGGKTLPFAIF